MTWYEIDVSTSKPVRPLGLDLVGQVYYDEEGHRVVVLGIDALLSTTHVWCHRCDGTCTGFHHQKVRERIVAEHSNRMSSWEGQATNDCWRPPT